MQRFDPIPLGRERYSGQGENVVSSAIVSQRVISPSGTDPLQQHQTASLASSKLDQESSSSLLSNLKIQTQHQEIVSDGNSSSSSTSLQFLIKLKSSLQKRNDNLSSECSEISQFLYNNSGSVVLPPEAINKLERDLSLLKEETRLVERRLQLIQQAELDTEGMIRELTCAIGTASRQETEKDDNTDTVTQHDQRVSCSPIRSGKQPDNSSDSPSSVLNCTSESSLDTSEDELLNFDSDEWFETRRKDPIVQDYIKTFELLMSQPHTNSSIVSEKEVWHLPDEQVCSCFFTFFVLDKLKRNYTFLEHSSSLGESS